MAIYHLSIKTISRSDGRTATAAAAYRAGDIVECAYTGLTHDYTRKSGVIASEIIAPKNAPDWVFKRSELWSRAELSEKRINSTVAREIEGALAHELSREQMLDLVRRFAEEVSERHSCVVDFALHEPSSHSIDEEEKKNFHFHMLLTTRRIDGNGFTEKTRELDSKKSGEVDYWRQRFAELTNKTLAAAGIDETVDHRSNAARGIERLPGTHLGPAATALRRRNQKTDKKSKRPLLQKIKLQKELAEVEEKIFLLKEKLEEENIQKEINLDVDERIFSDEHPIEVNHETPFEKWTTKEGNHVYLLPDKQKDKNGRRAAFIDRGSHIAVHMPGNDVALCESLLLAAKKWPDGIKINGNTEFREKAQRMANELGVHVINPIQFQKPSIKQLRL